MSQRSQVKTALGSVLAAAGSLVIVLSLILGWYSNPSPWVLTLGFVVGVIAGIGTALALGGLIEIRRER
jgi:CDP-diglyceride synthetase